MDREYAEQEIGRGHTLGDKEGPELRTPLRGTRGPVPTGIPGGGNPPKGSNHSRRRVPQ